ncbi:MAG: elongation factor P [Firmicutes bacterium]|nr:elongation factor P [Bacillota bacterium]
MISAGDIRKGTTFVYNNGVWTVIDFMHVKPGKGAAFVRTKIKNVITGQTLETSFNPVEKFEPATIEYKEAQYLYPDDSLCYFMDTTTYEQYPIDRATIEDLLMYLLEGCIVKIGFYKGSAFTVQPPTFVELDIVECEPAVKGDTSSSAGKVAKLETGLEVMVPLFIANGERIRVDTRTGEYHERVKK